MIRFATGLQGNHHFRDDSPQAFTSLTKMDTFIQNSSKFDQNSDVLRLQTDYGQAMALLNYSATKDQASAHRYQYL